MLCFVHTRVYSGRINGEYEHENHPPPLFQCVDRPVGRNPRPAQRLSEPLRCSPPQTIDSPPEAAAPNFSLNGGNYFGTRTLELTSQTPDAVIRFVLREGPSAPDPTPESPLYTAPVELPAGTLGNPKSYTVSARTFKDGMTPSPVVRALYSIDAPKARAEISIEAGNLYGTQQLTMSSPDNAEIRYESAEGTAADGTPNNPPREPVQGDVSEGTGSPIYDTSAAPPATITLTQGSVETPKTYTYWIRAFKEGFNPGDIIKLTFRVYPPKAAPVVIAQEPGEAFGRTILKLSSPTPGAEIRYLLTADGSEPGEPVQGDPSAGGSRIYDPAAPPSIKPERLNQTKTFKIKARAFKAGLSPSDVSPVETFPLKVAVKQISVGSSDGHSSGLSTLFLLLEDGSLWGVGDNRYGQLGNGSPASLADPRVTTLTRVMEDAATPLTDAREVTGSWKFTAVLKNDGTVYTFGDNTYGQLGRGSSPSITNYAVKVNGQSDIVSIAAGMDHLILVNRSGTAVAAGRNQYGQLAPSSSVLTSSPSFAPMTEKEDNFRSPNAITNIARAAAGHNHSLLLTRNDKVWAAGKNHKGQLGVGSQTNQNYLKPVNSVSGGGVLSDVVDIAGFDDTSLFILNDGRLVGAGNNNEYQLGLIKTIRNSVSTPLQLGTYSGTNRIDETLDTGITNAARLPRGGTQMDDFTFYIDTGGLVHAAGYTFRDQFTDGFLGRVSLNSNGFIQAPNIQNVQSAVTAAGAGAYMMFLLTDGSLKMSNGIYSGILSDYIEGSGPVWSVNPLK